MPLVLFILAVIGLAWTIAYQKKGPTKILQRIPPFLASLAPLPRSWRIRLVETAEYFVGCPICMGTWIGAALSATILSPSVQWIQWPSWLGLPGVSVARILFDALVACGACVTFHMTVEAIYDFLIAKTSGGGDAAQKH